MLVLAVTHINGLNVSVFHNSPPRRGSQWEESAMQNEFGGSLKKADPHHLASSSGRFHSREATSADSLGR